MDNKNKTDNKTKVFTDYNIFPGKVRLVMEDGKAIEIDRDDAIYMAKCSGKNLVQIAYNKNSFPKVVCKIIDYGKYLYEQQKKEKYQKKIERANRADVKEISFSIRIDENDRNIKIKHARGFLERGDNVKIIVRLSRREMNMLGMAKDMMYNICKELEDISELDVNPSFNSGIMSCVLKKRK